MPYYPATPAVWTTWTPTLTNISGGTINYAKYIQIGKTIHFRFRYTLAGAGVAGTPGITFPTALHADYDTAGADTSNFLCTGQLDDVTGSRYPIIAFIASSTRFDIYQETSSIAGISSTAPFTWAAGDVIEVQGTYEAA